MGSTVTYTLSGTTCRRSSTFSVHLHSWGGCVNSDQTVSSGKVVQLMEREEDSGQEKETRGPGRTCTFQGPTHLSPSSTCVLAPRTLEGREVTGPTPGGRVDMVHLGRVGRESEPQVLSY